MVGVEGCDARMLTGALQLVYKYLLKLSYRI